MKTRAFVALVLLSLFLASPALAAPKKVSTLVGSASYQDLDKIKSGTAAFDLTFPLGKHFALGPVVEYTYVKIDAEDAVTTTTITPGPTPEGGSETPGDVVGLALPVTDSDGKASVLAYGARLAFYVQNSHNGFGFSLEGLIPEADAEGFLLIPGFFFEAAAGSKGVFRMEYQHPFHSDHGEEIDLEGWRVSAGFGRRW